MSTENKALEAMKRAHEEMKKIHDDVGPLPIDVEVLRSFLPDCVSESAVACGKEVMNIAAMQRLCLGVTGALLPVRMLADMPPRDLINLSRFVAYGATFGAASMASMNSMGADSLDQILLAKTAAVMDLENEEGRAS